MTSLFALAHVRLTQAFASIRDREEGQGMAEYTFLVVAVIAAAATIVGLIVSGLTSKITSVLP